MKKQEEYWHVPRRFTPPEGDALKKAQELAESDRRGTVHEATAILKNEAGEIINIDKAVRDGGIPSYAPGSCKPLGVSAKNMIFVTDEEEVYADDLNKWLDKEYPRVKFRFQTACAEVDAVQGTSPRGDDKQRDATGQCYWRVIVNSNIKKMDKPKKASVRGVIKYLRGLNDARLPNKGKLDELIWIDDMGNEQCVQKKAISNAASEARKLS